MKINEPAAAGAPQGIAEQHPVAAVGGLALDPLFWSDDFDMDLPKIIPEAKSLLGEHAGLQLLTTGSMRDGMLMHPTIWNSHIGGIAMFSTRNGRWSRPAGYVTHNPTAVLTLWEAVRDCWGHSYVMLVDGVNVLNTERLYGRVFYPLMSHIRGWCELPAHSVEHRKMLARAAIKVCAKRVAKVLAQ